MNDDLTPDFAELANVAEQAADAAQKVIADALAAGDWAVRVKEDDSPVTDVDVAAEKAIRTVLVERTPEADFYGEETGRQSGVGRSGEDSGRPHLRWLVDPIDGTKSFVRGLPFYSTQIALSLNGELVVGVSNAPAFGERLVAWRGGETTLNGKRVTATDCIALDEVFLSSGNLTTLAGDSARWERYGALVAGARRVRGYGDFCHYHQLCAGGADLVIESDVNILDIAALTVGVRAAGGVITDLDGLPIGEQTTSVLAAATGDLHRAALMALSG